MSSVDVVHGVAVERSRGGRGTTARVRGAREVVLGLALPVGLVAVWQVVASTGLVSQSILPPPLEIVDAAVRLAGNGRLWDDISISLIRVVAGFTVGAVLAIVVGIAVGLSRTIDAVLSPTLLAIRAVPSLAWVPLLILWLGVANETPRVILIAIGAFFPVLATLVAGIRQVDPGLVEVARTYGLSRLQTVRTVLLPTAAPSLLAGARLGLAQAWLFLVASELIAASQGLGFMLVDAQNTGRVEVILLAIVLLAVIGKFTDLLLATVEKRVLARLR